jgi:hypothetical protein
MLMGTVFETAVEEEKKKVSFSVFQRLRLFESMMAFLLKSYK